MATFKESELYKFFFSLIRGHITLDTLIWRPYFAWPTLSYFSSWQIDNFVDALAQTRQNITILIRSKSHNSGPIDPISLPIELIWNTQAIYINIMCWVLVKMPE